jgi:ribonuclease BN (tRNA processing enzyme)
VFVTLIPSSATGTVPDHFQFLSSTVINGTLAIDAGSIGFYLSAEEQSRIRQIILTHSHIDHVASLPIFVENAFEGRPDCVKVYGSSDVLDSVRRDLFNNRLWPDFLALSEGKEKFLGLVPFEAGQTRSLEGLQVTAIAINHVVPTVGYIVADEHAAVAFISDTGPTDEIWQRLNALPRLDAVFVECCFPNSLAWLAEVSKHLTPALLAAEVRKLTRPTRIIVVHIKARFRGEVIEELQALKLPGLEIGVFGKPYEF